MMLGGVKRRIDQCPQGLRRLPITGVDDETDGKADGGVVVASGESRDGV